MHDIQNSGKLTIYFIKNSAMYSVLVVMFFFLLPFFFIYYACIYTRDKSNFIGLVIITFFVVSSTLDSFLSHNCRLYFCRYILDCERYVRSPHLPSNGKFIPNSKHSHSYNQPATSFQQRQRSQVESRAPEYVGCELVKNKIYTKPAGIGAIREARKICSAQNSSKLSNSIQSNIAAQ